MLFQYSESRGFIYLCLLYSCDCVGILKERNVDVEHRFPDQSGARNKKKSTRCRMVFRTTIAHDDGSTEVLQTTSQPIVCSKREICRLLLVRDRLTRVSSHATTFSCFSPTSWRSRDLQKVYLCLSFLWWTRTFYFGEKFPEGHESSISAVRL